MAKPFVELPNILQQANVRIKGKITRFQQELVAEVGKQLVQETPRDTGVLAANWYLAKGGTAPAFNPTPGTPERRLATLQAEARQLRANAKVSLANPTPYARFVEFGTSRMAPRAFVRRVASRLPATIGRVAARIRGER